MRLILPKSNKGMEKSVIALRTLGIALVPHSDCQKNSTKNHTILAGWRSALDPLMRFPPSYGAVVPKRKRLLRGR